MPRVCTVCAHKKREEIDLAIVSGEVYRNISQRFGVSNAAIGRHKKNHLAGSLAETRQIVREVDHAIDVMSELELIFERVNLLFDACDRYLRDADEPSRYDIGPRAADIRVTYFEPGPDGKPVKRKAKLSILLDRINQASGGSLDFRLVETKHADPRELVYKTAARLEGQLTLIARLKGELIEKHIMRETEKKLIVFDLEPEFVSHPPELADGEGGN